MAAWRLLKTDPVGMEGLPFSDPWKETRQAAIATHKMRWDRASDRAILDKATANGTWPLMLATDGGYIAKLPGSSQSRASAAAILLRAPALDGNVKWTDGTMTPVLIRIAVLPAHICSTRPDNGLAEAMAAILAEEMTPVGDPSIVIMDSSSERSRAQMLRDKGDDIPVRAQLRRIGGGVSKTLVRRLQTAMDENRPDPVPDPVPVPALQDPYPYDKAQRGARQAATLAMI
jgi:hypothetical protein